MPHGIPSSASPAIDDAALDRLLTSGAISIPDMTTRRAEFKLYTAAATTTDGDINPDTGNPRVRAIGSSTIRDLQGDTMELSALQDMEKAPPGLAIFVNHEYKIPEDLVGRLYDYPTTNSKRGIADLALDIEILRDIKPRAAEVYAGIRSGVRQGVSIGCMITAAQWVDDDGVAVPDDEIDFWDIWEGRLHLHITGVDPLEWSFVGIPANQRSWVQYAAQGLFRRSLILGDATNAKRLAPLVRSWFPTDFQHDLLDLAGGDASLRKTVSETPPRKPVKGGDKHILWLPDSATFGLRNTTTKRVTEVSRERVAALLAGEESVTSVPMNGHTKNASVDASVDASAVTKAATGKSDWPLGERDAAWDSGAAHKRITDWAGGTDDPDASKLKSVHFYSPEGDDAESVSKYKLLFCDEVSGAIKAMPRALMACWGAHGVEAADIPAEDKDAIKKKLSAYAARMREVFHDPDIMPPWDKEENKEDSAHPETEKTVSGSGGDITVKADGQHDAYSGTHTHSHPAYGDQGDDGNHEHTHSHDGDANHHHQHDKAADVEHVGESAGEHADEPTGGAIMAAQEIIDAPMTALAETASVSTQAPSDTVDSQRLALRKMFSDMLAPHGFVVLEATDAAALTAQTQPDKQACSWDDTQETAVRTGLAAVDNIVDGLMRQLGIPDNDDLGGSTSAPNDGQSATNDNPDNSDVAGPRYPAIGESATASAPARRLFTRAGARHSAADIASLQTIHDAVYALTDGTCCKTDATTPEGEGDSADGADTASGNGGGQSTTDLDEAQRLLGGGSASLSVLPQLIASIGEVATTLKGLSLPALDEKVKALSTAVDAAKAQQDALTAEQERTASEIARLRSTPQGRPTITQSAYAQRSAASHPDATIPTIPTVTAVSLTPDGQARDAARHTIAAKAQTTIQNVPSVGPCRLWPEGVGKDVRPALSHLQRMALEMGFTAIRRALPISPDGGATATSPEALIAAYTNGAAALIPIVLDGE